MTIARRVLLVAVTAGLAGPVHAQVDPDFGPVEALAPILNMKPLELSEEELDMIDAACRVERAYRIDRERLVTFRRQVVREGDHARQAAIDQLGRELDAWRKAGLEHTWVQLSFPARKALRERLDGCAAPPAEAGDETAEHGPQETRRRGASFKGNVAITHAQMDRELDRLRRVMNHRAATLEEMLPESDEPADSEFVSRSGNSVTIAMPEREAKERKSHEPIAITKSSCMMR